MARSNAIAAAIKAAPGRGMLAPQANGWGTLSPAAANMLYGNPYSRQYGPFLPRPSRIFSDGAFGPMPPIQPVPIDEPPPGGTFPDQRLWPAPVGWNLPTPPGTEGLKLACYSSDTEILTRAGWKLFPELGDEDEVATRNPQTRAFEWQKPAARHDYAYDGELIHFTSRGIDLLVTPNHRILYVPESTKGIPERIGRADECEQIISRHPGMVATSEWKAPNLDYWNVPAKTCGYFVADVRRLREAREALGWTQEQLAEKVGSSRSAVVRVERGTGRFHVASAPRIEATCVLLGVSPGEIIQPDTLEHISGDDFAALMGFYLSEGCVSPSTSGHLRIMLSQKPYSKGFEPYRALLVRILGREPYHDGSSWTFCHDGLARYLSQWGKSAPEKRIPPEILDLPPRQLRIFWDFYVLGDGWVKKSNNQQGITTTSRILAGQLQEVAQKIGLSATVYFRQPCGGNFRGRVIRGKRDRYDIHLRTTRNPKWTATRRVEYEGSVYCVSVPNGIVYVRRNGKAIWSGNSFDQLRTLSQKYSVARSCIMLRQQEIRSLEWDIVLTTDAAKAYRGDNQAMKDFGERKAQFKRFFRHPDPDFWSFQAFLNALLEEIFVYDALAIVFRPKYGAAFGMPGRGLLGSNLDCLQLVSGPTIRPLVGMHGEHPRPPAPAFQQFLYGVPRSDIPTIARGYDIEDYGLEGAEVNAWDVNTMLYAPYWPVRESPYGFPPVEQALLPIISGLQKQQWQLDYFTEGTMPAAYISPGDPTITPTQIRELQDALNAIAGDPAYHQKILVLPPDSKVLPQRPVDLSDSFDLMVQTQVTMAFDVNPIELGILPNIGGGSNAGPPSGAIRMGAMESREIKSRKSTKPLLAFICDIFNMVIQDVCGQHDMKFEFEGLVDDQAKTELISQGIQKVQNGIASIDEVREELDLAPWGLPETSEPVVFTAQGPVPFSLAPKLIEAAITGQAPAGRGSNTGQKDTGTRQRNSQITIRQGGQTKPNGTHPAQLAPHREPVPTPGHAAAAGAIQGAGPRTGGTPNRSQVAGSRKTGATTAASVASRKAAAISAELDSLKRHLRKGMQITDWQPEHIDNKTLRLIAEDTAKGVLLDVAVDRAYSLAMIKAEPVWDEPVQSLDSAAVLDASILGSGRSLDVRQLGSAAPLDAWAVGPVPALDVPGVDTARDLPDHLTRTRQWPGWEHDLGLVGRCQQEISQAFQDAEIAGRQLRKKMATGEMLIPLDVLRGLISDEVEKALTPVMRSMWARAWQLGYEAGEALVTGKTMTFTGRTDPPPVPGGPLEGFLDSEGAHWAEKVGRTGLGNSGARSEMIARTEVARAMNAGAIQAYRDHGVAYKHLLTAPDDVCVTCEDAAGEGVIPLDELYPGGTLGGPLHVMCRCVAAPAGITLEPPQAHIGKNDQEDKSRLAWLLLRARDEDGKYRFLLQQRDDGTWGMPGGSTHVGEDPFHAAVRETTEEIGDLPMSMVVAGTFHHVEDDGETRAYLYLCDVPFFRPRLNGSTPHETRGTGWYRRKEIGDLDLAPKFKEDWEDTVRLRDHVTKALAPGVNGEILVDPAQNAQGGGLRWPYPHRPDETEVPVPGLVPGGTAGEMGAPEPPGHRIGDTTAPAWNDFSDRHQTDVYEGDETDQYPRRRTRNRSGPRKFPDQGGERWPATSNGGPQSPASAVGARTGIPPSGVRKAKPVTGSVPAEAPQPADPHAIQPEVTDPGDTIIHQGPDGSNVLPAVRKDAADYNDANPVEAEHVYLLMAKNFPPDAISWVKRARWTGPVWVPWDRIDTDDKDKWAASHQLAKVKEFERAIRAHDGRVAPSIIVQEPSTSKAFIVDGHHRALAHENLGQKVLAYLGNIDPKDREAALETHSKQIHSGSDPENK